LGKTRLGLQFWLYLLHRDTGTQLIKLFVVDIVINYFQLNFFSLSPNKQIRRNNMEHLGMWTRRRKPSLPKPVLPFRCREVMEPPDWPVQASKHSTEIAALQNPKGT